MNRGAFVYLSGPMTAKGDHTIEENVTQGLNAHLALLKHGVPNFCPMLGGAFPSAWSDVPYDVWLAFDLAVIDRCTHVLMLPRWEQSKGANIERDYAESIAKPVLYSVGDLCATLAIG